jgi:hypothetical protein
MPCISCSSPILLLACVRVRACFRASNGDLGKTEVRGAGNLDKLEVACLCCFFLLLRVSNCYHLLSMLWRNKRTMFKSLRRSTSLPRDLGQAWMTLGSAMALAYRSDEGVRGETNKQQKKTQGGWMWRMAVVARGMGKEGRGYKREVRRGGWRRRMEEEHEPGSV